MIFVIASSELKPGCKEEFIRIAAANIPNVLAEEGCISYKLNGDAESGLAAQTCCGENTLVFVECWESVAHLQKHLQTPHMKDFCEKVKNLRISSSLHVVTPVC